MKKLLGSRYKITQPSRSLGPAFAQVLVAGSSTSSISYKLEAEGRAGRQGRIADHLARLDFVVLDELGYLPSPRPADNCCSI